jgi:hypothetical protein
MVRVGLRCIGEMSASSLLEESRNPAALVGLLLESSQDYVWLCIYDTHRSHSWFESRRIVYRA